MSGIPYTLDFYRQFVTSVDAIFFRTHRRISIPPRSRQKIIASILSQNRTFQGDLRDRFDSVREIATVAMNEPDGGMSLAIFNAEGALVNDHQLEVIHNCHHTQKLSRAYMFYNQLVYPLIFWTGSGRRGVMESEKMQDRTTLI
jgi:hypothetical protein